MTMDDSACRKSNILALLCLLVEHKGHLQALVREGEAPALQRTVG